MSSPSSMNDLSAAGLYSPAVTKLLAEQRRNALGPGRPNRAVEADLRRLSPTNLCGDQKLVDPPMAEACLAGLWLYHDFLDESHRLSQDGEDVSFRYWHGMMHRREPDYGNAKYWFHRVGNHPIFSSLLCEAQKIGRDDVTGGSRIAESNSGMRQLLAGRTWDPFAFIDLCEAAASDQPELENLCRSIAACEWRLLFDYCYRKAIDKTSIET